MLLYSIAMHKFMIETDLQETTTDNIPITGSD